MSTRFQGLRKPCKTSIESDLFHIHIQQQQSFFVPSTLGRLEMKPRMKTSELNPKKRGNKGKGEPKNDETGKHIKEIKPTRTSKI
jgi:hypothetical protein